MSRSASITRTTRETDVTIRLDFTDSSDSRISTGLPFFDHMLHSMAYHGRFHLTVEGSGDTQVDPHHLVEDTGIVLGSCLGQIFSEGGAVNRFGHSVIPMDEALSEATVDISGRSTLHYRPDFPQDHSGDFAMWLFREFFLGLSLSAKISLHLTCRYGENAHHMIEALFKALGKAIAQAYSPADTAEMSTKGTI